VKSVIYPVGFFQTRGIEAKWWYESNIGNGFGWGNCKQA
jgi:hypothetical protein